MVYLMGGAFAGLVIGFALEWAVDWPALRHWIDRRERFSSTTVRGDNPAPPEDRDEPPPGMK